MKNTKQQHTPETWTFKKNMDGHGYTVFNDGFAVAQVFATMATGKTADHDARLIVMAPELFDLVERMQIRIFMLDGMSELCGEARDVMAKAQGEGGKQNGKMLNKD